MDTTNTVAGLLKKELKVQKLATVGEDKIRKMAGDISIDKAIAIAKTRMNMYGDTTSKVKQVVGACQSCGVTIDGKLPKDVMKEIEDGKVKIN
jgi:large subunit ribosomal protein L11